jgi:hypothetical protein
MLSLRMRGCLPSVNSAVFNTTAALSPYCNTQCNI